MTNEQMRADFESWFKDDDNHLKLGRNGSGYTSTIAEISWFTWQAATATATQWRPIADAPKTGEWIIVCDGTGNVRPDYWLGAEFYQWAKEPHGAVNTHWQYLPVPPTGTGENHG